MDPNRTCRTRDRDLTRPLPVGSPQGYGGEHVQSRACELVKIHDPREQTGTISENSRGLRERVGTFGGGVKETRLSVVERST